MPSKFQRPKGTHDVLPGEHLWWELVRVMEEQAARYGWGRIQTPGFEETALFARTAGEASDVVNKEMYTFKDRAHRSLTLRPEGTAPIVRAYVEHGLHREPQPVKAYTIAPMYRYGAPGRGRYREHWQLSLEAIGAPGPDIDAEVIQFYVELLGRLGVTEWELRLNSIGDANCRPQYVERLNKWLDDHADILDDDARHKRATSPLQVFDIKNPALRSALEQAPKIGESLCDECQTHFDGLRALLDALNVRYIVDPVLVRGLDYYTRTTFEFVGPEDNVNSTICGGGRYDGLVEAIGGPSTPGIGFGAGIERLRLAVEREIPTFDQPQIDVFFAVEQGQSALTYLKSVRDAGFSADTDYGRRSLRNQLEHGRRRARRVVLLSSGEMTLRKSGELDRTVDLAELLKDLRS